MGLVRITFLLVGFSAGCARESSPRVATAPKCKPAKTGLQLANGTITDAYPEVVDIYMTKGMTASHCTGTVIGYNVVLTAAHCLRGDGPSSYRIYFGRNAAASRQNPDAPYVPVAQVVGIPILTDDPTLESMTRDLAMLITAAPMDGDHFKIAKGLPTAASAITSVGYGRTKFEEKGDLLPRFAQMRVTQLLQNGGLFTTESTYYEGYNLPGDSGGPKFIGREIYGVVSSISGNDAQNGVISYNASLVTPYAQGLFAEATAKGAKIGENKPSAAPAKPSTSGSPAAAPSGDAAGGAAENATASGRCPK